MEIVGDKLGGSELRACPVLRQHRPAQRHAPRDKEDRKHLVVDMINLTSNFVCCDYRRAVTLLRDTGLVSK